MGAEGSAQAQAVPAGEHANPKKRRKVNHGMEDQHSSLLPSDHPLTHLACSVYLLPALGEPP